MRTDRSGFASLGLAAWGAIILCFCAASGWASVFYVDAGASGGNTGASWVNAYTDLQAALTATEWGDEIWVAAGTYKPTNGTDRNISFDMTPGVAIYGGFNGTETDRTQRDAEANETILSGDIGVEGDITDNSFHVVTGSHMATLDGFIVTAGHGSLGCGLYNKSVSLTVAHCTFSGNSAGSGGGMYNDDSYTTVTHCTFIDNTANAGGGMSNTGGSPSVTDCAFIGNRATNGGGMYNNYSSPTVIRCTFKDNVNVGYGGGMYNSGMASMENNSPTVTQCIFTGNEAHYGAGMYNIISGSALTVMNCIFTSNTAAYEGGGIDNDDSNAPIVASCIFTDNSSERGGGIYGGSGTTVNCIFTNNSANFGGGVCEGSGTFSNCIFWKNSSTQETDEIRSFGAKLTFSHCDIRNSGGSGALWDTSLGTDGGGSIMADPLFVDMENPAGPDGIWMTEDDGLALGTGSPCIDSGDTDNAPASDILGRMRSGAVDIGAYEFGDESGIVSWMMYH